MTIRDKIQNYFDGVPEITPMEQARHDALLRKVLIGRRARDKRLSEKFNRELQELYNG